MFDISKKNDLNFDSEWGGKIETFSAFCPRLYQIVSKAGTTELTYSVSNYNVYVNGGGTEVQRNIAEGECNFLNFWFLQLENTARLDATRNFNVS